jgi:transposase
MLAKALLGARSQLLGISQALENQIRGILKTFGRIVPKGGGGLFEKNVRALITEEAEIAAVIMPLLQARQVARDQCAALDRRLVVSVQDNAACRMLMTMPGIGPITAVAYVAALERPDTCALDAGPRGKCTALVGPRAVEAARLQARRYRAGS